MKKIAIFIIAGILCVFGIAVRAVSQSAVNDVRSKSPGDYVNTIDIKADGYKNTNGNPVGNKDFIGEEKAYEIVLKKTELSPDEVSYKRVKLDFDDGIYIYEVEIKSGRLEYDADVNALNGDIISFEKDFDD